MMINNLLQFRNIVVQCHDNPDADALASGFGLYTYLALHNASVRLVYGGNNKIKKANLMMMIEALDIPVEHVSSIGLCDLLITVDCQYGCGNVTRFDASNIAVVDHHAVEREAASLFSVIRPQLGSCSTLVWSLLNDSGFNYDKFPNLSTALYYGLYSDTNNFSEMYHPLDKDMADSLKFEKALFKKFKNSNLTLEELTIAGVALTRHKINGRVGLFSSDCCDPNILGFISDIALQISEIDVCVVYMSLESGIKFSVRSCTNEIMANEMAEFLTRSIGSGGGHNEKAGGFIVKSKLEHAYPGMLVQDYMSYAISHYLDNYDFVYWNDYHLTASGMDEYEKLRFAVGYVKTTDFSPVGSSLNIRTLEGDISLVSSDNLFIMIGLKGEIYPIKEEKLLASYELTDQPFSSTVEYFPTATETLTGKVIKLSQYAHECFSNNRTHILAKKLIRDTKVFTQWDKDRYMLGKTDDYIAMRSDDPLDVYIISNDIFKATYAQV